MRDSDITDAADRLDRARRAKDIFETALDLPGGARRRYLESACAGDAPLRREVEELFLHLDAATTDELFPSLDALVSGPDLVGRRVGPYEIERKIAEGGMGAVYRARRHDLDLRVAFKVIRQGQLASPAQRERFQREQRILARLDDPGIARVLDAGVSEENIPYLVMEFVEGLPIDRWCDGRRLSIAKRLALFERVCGAVAQAHRAGVVHRDLKPSNILVSETGEPKLLDFGIARLVGSPAAGDAEGSRPDGRQGSPPTTLVATPDYAAPEQLQGEPVSAATDVYSLGVVLYELLTGRRPWRLAGRALSEIAHLPGRDFPVPPSRRVARDESRVRSDGRVERWTLEGAAALRSCRPRSLRRRLQGDLDAIVLKALREEPAARYGGAGDLAEDLARHRRGLPVHARPRTPGYLARRFARRHRWLLAGVGAVAAAGLGGWGLLTAREEAPPDVVAADLIAVNDFITCEGETPGPHRRRGTLTARRTPEGLAVTVLLEEGEPNRIYSIELFEAVPDCLDNFADTGVRLSTEAGGLGLATVEVPLPHPSLGGRTLGDGRGPERVVLVLDRSLSAGSGDAFVATFPLPRPPPGPEDGERLLASFPRTEGQTVAQALDSLEAAARERPGEAELWFVLGDFLYHYGPLLGRPSESARRALERALTLAPDHDRARHHLLFLEAIRRDTAAFDSLARLLEASDLTPGTRRQVRVMGAQLGLEPDAFRPESYADSTSEIVVRRLQEVLRYNRNLEAGRILARHLDDPFRSLPIRAQGRVALARIAATEGRWEEAVRHLVELESAAPFLALSERVLLATHPLGETIPDTLRALGARLRALDLGPAVRLVRPPVAVPPREVDRSLHAYLGGVVALSLSERAATDPTTDSAIDSAVDSVLAVLRRRARASTDPTAGYLTDALAARRLEVEGRPEEATRAREEMAIPTLAVEWDHGIFFAPERARRAELLRRTGRPSEALDWFASLPDGRPLEILHLPLAELRRGEILDELGRAEEAVGHYRSFVRLWSQADPAFAPLVDRVAGRLEELAGDRSAPAAGSPGSG